VAALVKKTAPPSDIRPGVAPTARLLLGSRPARILIMDQHDPAVWTLRRRLESLGAVVQMLEAPGDVVARAREHPPDLILLDVTLPTVDGLELIRELKRDSTTHAVPVMALSVLDPPERRIQCLSEGACDFIGKPFDLEEVLARIRVVLRGKSQHDVLRRRISFLEELAASDPLTNLLNRRAFEERLYLEVERAMQNGEPLSCLVLDIDWFKSVNDRYGHHVGDDVLRQVAKIILERRRKFDAVCRYGGEEFVWLLPGAKQVTLMEWAEWVRRTIEETEIPTMEGSFHVTISIGASSYSFREHGRITARLLLEQADAALLEAKRLGKNRVAFRELLAPPSAAHTALARALERFPAERAGTAETLEPEKEIASADAASPEAVQRELRALLHSSVKVLVSALDAKDPETMAHSRRVSNLAVALAVEMKLPLEEVERIRIAGLLHDLGKLAVPEAILQKPGPLTAEEMETVRKHPERGAAMLAEAKAFRHLVDLVLYHQESFDGKGYPEGLTGENIPLGARIIHVADTFDAMMNDQPYRSRKTMQQTQDELREMAGHTLDPTIVEIILRLLATMPPIDLQMTLWGASDMTDLGTEDEATLPDRAYPLVPPSEYGS